MKFTIVESPYSGDIEANTQYARDACYDCIQRNENPFASHLFYTQFLDDSNESDRCTGIRAGFEWGWIAHHATKAPIHPAQAVVAFYVDKGWSEGMEDALAYYTDAGLKCEIRRLTDWSPVPQSTKIDTPDE